MLAPANLYRVSRFPRASAGRPARRTLVRKGDPGQEAGHPPAIAERSTAGCPLPPTPPLNRRVRA